MTLTQKQIDKMNGQLANGFKLDVYYTLTHNEKTPSLRVYPDPNNKETFYEVMLLWIEETAPKTNNWGQSYKVRTGNYIPCIHLAHYKNLVSHGLGHFIEVKDKVVARRTFKTLAEISKSLTPAKVQELINDPTARMAMAKETIF